MSDLINIPKDGPGWSCDASINTEAWLKAVTDEELTEDLDRYTPDTSEDDNWRMSRDGWDNADEVLIAVNAIAEEPYREACRDNVCNSENDFDSVFTFTVFEPINGKGHWLYDECFIAVCIHAGGDVRGNYGPPRLFRVDCPAESGFLDWTHGWHVETPIKRLDARNKIAVIGFEHSEEKSERVSQGYASNPTSELYYMYCGESGEWSDGAFVHEGSEDRCWPYLYVGC